MKRTIITLLFALGFTFSAFAQMVNFKNKNPDIIFQSAFNQYSQQFVLYQLRHTLMQLSEDKKDIFNQTLELPEFPPYVHENEVSHYVKGDLGDVIMDVLGETFNRNVFIKGATTTVDIYELAYKLGRPRFSVSYKKAGSNGLDISFKFSVTSIEITVDAVYLNNHSPGIVVKRGRDNRPTRIFVADANGNPVRTNNMRQLVIERTTLLDDIYVKVQPAAGKPLIRIDGGADGSYGRNRSVLSGELKLRITPGSRGKYKVQYRGLDIELFGSKNGEQLARYIQLNLGNGSKIGGLTEIGYGRSTQRILHHNLIPTLQSKKEELTKSITVPLFDQIFNLDLGNLFKERLKDLDLAETQKLTLSEDGLSGELNLTNLGFIKEGYNDDPQLSIGASMKISNRGYRMPRTLPFPLVKSNEYKKSKEVLYDIIDSDEKSLILSFSQDFINKSILTAMKGKFALEALPEGATIGKKGLFAIFDDDDQGKVVMDLTYKKKGFERFLATVFTLRSKYHFPLIMFPNIRIEEVRGVPTLLATIDKVDITKDTLKNGKYGVESNVNRGTLRKVVLNEVKAELEAVVGTELLALPLPYFKGIDPTLFDLRSDGHGRLNLSIDLDPTRSNSRKLYRELPRIIAEIVKTVSKK